jgi:hypothetical protein
MDDRKLKIIGIATKFLLSKEIQEAVKEKRGVSEGGGNLVLDTKLWDIATKAEKKLIPTLIEFQPRLKSAISSYAVRFINGWVGTYIKDAANYQKTDKSLAKYYAREFVKDAAGDYYLFREITPLIKFAAEREFYLIRKDKDTRVTYRFLKHDFRLHARALSFHRIWFSSEAVGDLADKYPYDWLLLVEQRIPRINKFAGDTTIKHGFFTSQILDVIRLFKDQEFRTINSYGSSSTFLFAGVTDIHRGDFPVLPHGQKYYLSEAEIKKLGKYWRKIKNFIPFDKMLPSNLEMASRYFRASEKKPLHERFLDIAISLEALFSIEAENTYRLPIRVSTFLHGHTDKAIDIYEDVRAIWKFRNHIAHGNFDIKNKKKYNQLNEMTPKLRCIVRISINKHLELFSALERKGKSYKDFMKKDFEKKYVIGNGLKRPKK